CVFLPRRADKLPPPGGGGDGGGGRIRRHRSQIFRAYRLPRFPDVGATQLLLLQTFPPPPTPPRQGEGSPGEGASGRQPACQRWHVQRGEAVVAEPAQVG